MDEDQIGDAINLLSLRMGSLGAKSVEAEIRANSPRLRAHEFGFQSTVLRIFGEDSDEYRRLGSLTFDFDHVPEPDKTSHAVVLNRLRGREYMIQVCVELTTQLQNQIQVRRWRGGSETGRTPSHTLHPKIDAASSQLAADGHHWEAVFAACKQLVHMVKEKSGRHDLDGTQLMRHVFSKNTPLLFFNELKTQSDQDEQEGMMSLFAGVVMALRNPGGHGFPSGTEARARQYLALLSLLAEKVDEAIVKPA